jgi:uncharacterized protein DUF2867
LVRDARKLTDRPWAADRRVETRQADMSTVAVALLARQLPGPRRDLRLPPPSPQGGLRQIKFPRHGQHKLATLPDEPAPGFAAAAAIRRYCSSVMSSTSGVSSGSREITLRAEMKVSGVAELHFRVEPLDAQGAMLIDDVANGALRSRLRLIARFRSMGIVGLTYWYAMLPLHSFLFRRMLKRSGLTAQRLAARAETT